MGQVGQSQQQLTVLVFEHGEAGFKLLDLFIDRLGVGFLVFRQLALTGFHQLADGFAGGIALGFEPVQLALLAAAHFIDLHEAVNLRRECRAAQRQQILGQLRVVAQHFAVKHRCTPGYRPG